MVEVHRENTVGVNGGIYDNAFSYFLPRLMCRRKALRGLYDTRFDFT